MSKIDKIRYNNTDYDISDNYSAEEEIIGTWIDGKNLYRKVLVLTEIPTSGNNKQYTTNIDAGNANITKISGILKNPNGSTICLPYKQYVDIQYWGNQSIIVIINDGFTDTSYSTAYVVLEYTKNNE